MWRLSIAGFALLGGLAVVGCNKSNTSNPPQASSPPAPSAPSATPAGSRQLPTTAPSDLNAAANNASQSAGGADTSASAQTESDQKAQTLIDRVKQDISKLDMNDAQKAMDELQKMKPSLSPGMQKQVDNVQSMFDKAKGGAGGLSMPGGVGGGQ